MSAIAITKGRPFCECGGKRCRATLPPEAWVSAGEGGIGRGPGGADVYAVMAGHVRSYHEVVSEHNGWVAVLENGGDA